MMQIRVSLCLTFILCTYRARSFVRPPIMRSLQDIVQQGRSVFKEEPSRLSLTHARSYYRGSCCPGTPTVLMSTSETASSAVPPSTPEGSTPNTSAEPETGTTIKPGVKISNEWELDVYSRPVIGTDGKKLWELLICDSTGNLRHVSPIPSNMVNSREVRKAIQGVIEEASEKSRPTMIRFFRNAMFNMIDIALRDVDVAVRPCRTTYAMYQWLEERERDVYPNMPGFKPNMKQANLLDIRVSMSQNNFSCYSLRRLRVCCSV